MGQQLQESQMGQAIGQRFQESVPQEVQQLVADLERFETITEWVKSRATQRGMPRVASRADDLAGIAHLEKQLVLRESPFAEPIGQATQQTIQQGIQDLQHRAGEPEVQEALTHAQQVVADIGQALGRLQAFGQQGQQPQPGQQPQLGQPSPQGQQAQPGQQGQF
jgi:hypothetical protein